MIKGFVSIYSWRYPRALIALLQQKRWRIGAYLAAYWHTVNFTPLARAERERSNRAALLESILYVGMTLEAAVGVWLLVRWHWYGMVGGWEFGLAALVATPVVWAHLIVVPLFIWKLVHPKIWGRAVVCAILERQVRRLRNKHHFMVVAVAGSIGKTSSKIAIARLLQASRRVRWQEGNYNDRVTVPLVFFGQDEPGLLNVIGWLKVFMSNARQIRGQYPYNVVVVELGTDAPGFMEEFTYVKPDLGVLTAISAEHMEFFGTLDGVAEEELQLFRYADQRLVNMDDIDPKYLEGKTYHTYGMQPHATYYAARRRTQGLAGQHLTFYVGKKHRFDATISLLGEQGAKVAVAAVAAGHLLGLSSEDIEAGLANVGAFAGRMQVLHGIKDTTIIDDTYNASPVAFKAALDVLQSGNAPQRIAIMGSMNELGQYSPEAHREVGEYCDPSKLDWVVTIGKDAQDYLAPVAKARGCQVKTFMSPYKAGAFVKNHLQAGAVVLAKGSQNGVFAEEALKTLLVDPADEAKLVRQSAHWKTVKQRQFPS